MFPHHVVRGGTGRLKMTLTEFQNMYDKKKGLTQAISGVFVS
jgi:hypothetical protein